MELEHKYGMDAKIEHKYFDLVREEFVDGKKRTIRRCKICQRDYKGTASVNSNFITHLKHVHPELLHDWARKKAERAEKATSFLSRHQGTSMLPAYGRNYLSSISTAQVPKGEFMTNPLKGLTPTSLASLTNMGQSDADRQVAIMRSVLNYLVMDIQPASVINRKGFRNLMRAMHPFFGLPTASQIRDTLIPSAYEHVKDSIISQLSLVPVVNLQISVISNCFVAVTAYYLSVYWELKHHLLAVYVISPGMEWENLVEQTKSMYGITNKIYYEKVNKLSLEDFTKNSKLSNTTKAGPDNEPTSSEGDVQGSDSPDTDSSFAYVITKVIHQALNNPKLTRLLDERCAAVNQQPQDGPLFTPYWLQVLAKLRVFINNNKDVVAIKSESDLATSPKTPLSNNGVSSTTLGSTGITSSLGCVTSSLGGGITSPLGGGITSSLGGCITSPLGGGITSSLGGCITSPLGGCITTNGGVSSTLNSNVRMSTPSTGITTLNSGITSLNTGIAAGMSAAELTATLTAGMTPSLNPAASINCGTSASLTSGICASSLSAGVATPPKSSILSSLSNGLPTSLTHGLLTSTPRLNSSFHNGMTTSIGSGLTTSLANGPVHSQANPLNSSLNVSLNGLNASLNLNGLNTSLSNSLSGFSGLKNGLNGLHVGLNGFNATFNGLNSTLNGTLNGLSNSLPNPQINSPSIKLSPQSNVSPMKDNKSDVSGASSPFSAHNISILQDLALAVELVDILEPFEEVYNLISSETTPSVGIIVPSILSLDQLLRDIKSIYLGDLVLNLSTALQKHLAPLLRQKYYQEAAALDPRFKLKWCRGSQEESRVQARLEELAQELRISNPSPPPNFYKADENVNDSKVNEQATKRRKLFSFLEKSDEKDVKPSSALLLEFNDFVREQLLLDYECPFRYWQEKCGTYRCLAQLSYYLCSIPACPPPVDKVFLEWTVSVNSFQQCNSLQELERLFFLNVNSSLW